MAITQRSGRSYDIVPHGRLVGVEGFARQTGNFVSRAHCGTILRKELSILWRKLHTKFALGVIDLLFGWMDPKP